MNLVLIFFNFFLARFAPKPIMAYQNSYRTSPKSRHQANYFASDFEHQAWPSSWSFSLHVPTQQRSPAPGSLRRRRRLHLGSQPRKSSSGGPDDEEVILNQ